MGKVAWDKNQQNRSWIARVDPDHLKELGVFEAAASELGHAKWIKTEKGDSFPVPESSVPELVAANLASGDHWCTHFRDLVAKKQDFINMGFRLGGPSSHARRHSRPCRPTRHSSFSESLGNDDGSVGRTERVRRAKA